MSTTHSNSKLVPKVIIDVNNNIKTVWVKPEHADAETLAQVPPTLKYHNLDEDGLRTDVIGRSQGSLLHTKEERTRSAERKYGSDALAEAAAAKFVAEFGVDIENAPPVEMDDERVYDYLAEGLTTEQAYEFKRFGIEPQESHPKLDAEYIFVSGPKVAKLDLRDQKQSDSGLRKQELRNIKVTARALQMAEVDPGTASRCISNGLRKEHMSHKHHSLEDIIKMSYSHNVESPEFKKFIESNPNEGNDPHPDSWFARQSRQAGVYMRRAAMRSLRRRGRRLYNNVNRRVTRFLKLAFLPWKTR